MQEHVMPGLPQAPKRGSAVDLVINGIKQMVVTGRVRPGDRLPTEMELAASLSVSRGSVREAMKILSAFGIVDIIRGDGTYVATSMRKTFFGPLFFSLIASKGDAERLVELREMVDRSDYRPKRIRGRSARNRTTLRGAAAPDRRRRAEPEDARRM